MVLFVEVKSSSSRRLSNLQTNKVAEVVMTPLKHEQQGSYRAGDSLEQDSFAHPRRRISDAEVPCRFESIWCHTVNRHKRFRQHILILLRIVFTDRAR